MMSNGFKWDDYLNLAKELSDHGHGGFTPSTPESRRRTAISRSYYAVLHQANAYIRKEEPRKRLDDHGDTWRWFKDQDEISLRKIGHQLDRLYGFRHKADYKDVISDASELAWTAVVMADEIESLLPGSAS